jgi:hypothetical protein
MATKAGLISAINGFITSVVNITKHRNSMLELVNELFQTTTIQTLTTGSDVYWHNLRYKKIGNIVYIDGTITNKYLTTQNASLLVTIPNSQYFAKTGEDTIVRCNSNFGDVTISFATSSISSVSPVSPNAIIYINSHYQTND